MLFFFSLSLLVMGQKDTIWFTNDEMVIGEIQSMDKGVVSVETNYSDSDFQIDWDKVLQIRTHSRFLVILKNEKKYLSALNSVNDSIVIVYPTVDQGLACNIKDIVYLNPIEEEYIDRLSAAIDIGTDLAKAKNLRSITMRSSIGYTSEKWSTDGTFSTLRSKQDSVALIQRTEGDLNFRLVLPQRLYLITTWSLLSNTEQKLKVRSNAQAGLGMFIHRSNSAYWGAKVGFNRNIEKYTNETAERKTWEAFIGTELNLYDIGDFSLSIAAIAYPSFNEKGRWRSDASLDLKYDLPYDFYIRFGGSVNYDNQPAEGASEVDYVIQTGFGWEW